MTDNNAFSSANNIGAQGPRSITIPNSFKDSPSPTPAPPVFPIVGVIESEIDLCKTSELERSLLQGRKVRMSTDTDKSLDTWFIWLGHEGHFSVYLWRVRTSEIYRFPASDITAVSKNYESNTVSIVVSKIGVYFIKTDDFMDMEELYFLFLNIAKLPIEEEVKKPKEIKKMLSIESISPTSARSM